MYYRKLLFLVPLAPLLAACANPIPASRSTADLIAAENELFRIQSIAEPGTPVPGIAEFEGLMGGPIQVDGDAGSDFLGDLEMTVDFALGDVNGSVRDITLFDDGEPDQNLGGTLTVTGAFGGALTAAAVGTLSAVEEAGALGLRGDTNITINMTGTLVDDAGINTFVGTATGGGSGDYEVFLEPGVGFFAAQQ